MIRPALFVLTLLLLVGTLTVWTVAAWQEASICFYKGSLSLNLSARFGNGHLSLVWYRKQTFEGPWGCDAELSNPYSEHVWTPDRRPFPGFDFGAFVNNYSHLYQFTFPLYWPTLPLTLSAAFQYRRLFRHHRPNPTLCPTCNYDLRATPTQCPECGTPNPTP